MRISSVIRRSLCILGAAALAAASLSAAAQQAPIKFGATYPLTGPLAGFAKDLIPALEMGVADINARGGIKGRPVQLVLEDSRSSPEGGVASYRKVVEVDKAAAVLSVMTNVVTAQIPLADQMKVPVLSGVEAPGLSAKGQFSFAHSNRSSLALPALVQHFKAVGLKRVFTFLPDNAFGEIVSKGAQEAVKSIGAEYSEARFKLGAGEYRGIVARGKEFSPDAVMIVSQGTADDGNVIRQLREIGVNAPIFMTSNMYDTKPWRDSVGAYVEGMIMSGLHIDQSVPAAKDFYTRYRAKNGRPPSYVHAEIYDMTMMIADAIDKVGADGVAIRDYMVSLKDFPTVLGGKFSMAADRQSVLPVSLWRVRGDQLVRIKPGDK